MSKVYNLFSQTSRHPKVVKNGQKLDVYSLIMHLAPAARSGYEVCPMRSAGCTAACLNTAGFQYARKEAARVARTKLYFEDRKRFMEMLVHEIQRGKRYAEKRGYLFGVRLNGTSDITWESVRAPIYCPHTGKAIGEAKNIMEVYPTVPFYDYTKRANRKNLPENYRLTFSRSEDNNDDCIQAIRNGMNIAVVFSGNLPTEFVFRHSRERGMHTTLPVIDGDEHDFRYDDPRGVIVGLRAKGKARHDTTGFVVNV
jgi:hypothetical protein